MKRHVIVLLVIVGLVVGLWAFVGWQQDRDADRLRGDFVDCLADNDC